MATPLPTVRERPSICYFNIPDKFKCYPRAKSPFFNLFFNSKKEPINILINIKFK
ncbi:hypothetical protein PROVRUST_07180 [Providencia rustigianii DSM 4541]|uniref:Uncharacterized protein n=1 Tax=Providencia rustigianii DSM 4541 TaxID=500637 RepID=D1P4M8_9GAMM|nr:hypothetical protein PROVRUST_07180 [Providencia rustigianii DSM 4541]